MGKVMQIINTNLIIKGKYLFRIDNCRGNGLTKIDITSKQSCKTCPRTKNVQKCQNSINLKDEIVEHI